MTTISKRIAELSPEKRRLLMERLKKKNGKTDGYSINRQSRETNRFPLSFAQQRLWFLDQIDSGSFTWNIPMIVRLSGELNLDAFQRAIQEIVQRHEVLRTTFATENGEPVQVIAREGNVKFEHTDLSNLPAAERNEEFKHLALQEAQRPFDLAQGPPMRASLLKLGKREFIFLVTMHHVVSDAWSIGLFYQELGTLYKAFSAGLNSPLPELGIQYADFSVWQRGWLQGENLRKQLKYWTDHLAGAPRTLGLPTDRPRPAVQTFHGETEFFKSHDKLLEALKKLSQESGATLFMTCLAAFKVLLHRYTGQDDIVVGSPIAGRNRAETEELIGFFINNLTLRTDLAGNPTFRELITRVRETSLGAFAHQDLPFEKLVEEIQPERNLSASPLFQVMFILQNTPLDDVELPGLKLSSVAFNTYRTSRFDLSLYMAENENGRLIAALEYNTDLFHAATIKRMVGHLETLLEEIVANPDKRLSELSMMMAAEKQKVLFAWNNTADDYPQSSCFHHLFETQVKKTPDALAVVFEERELTYTDLNARANQLAHHLQKIGVGPDVLVGVCLERSPEMVVGLLAILKAGGAYVPVDPAYPRERVVFMLEDAGISLLLTEEKLLESLPKNISKTLCIDSSWQAFARESKENLQSRVCAQNLAYVIYTSGSTGKPKGVAIQHFNLVNFLCTMGDEPGLTGDDILLAVTTLSFDIAGLELYLPLCKGGRVVLASREVAADGRKLIKAIKDCGTTVMQATPATWHLLLESEWPGDRQLKMLCGGEALPAELANRLVEKGASLWNMYGPTETTIWSAVRRVLPGESLVSVGRAIANTQIYILDRNLQPVPIGVHGELLIGGDGLARAYLNQPELTADKFIPDPFSKEPGARLYRTGDLARFLVNGNIEFISRIDNQVKIRGFRIELGEIEAVLAQHQAVEQSVAIVREDNPGDKRLVAYLVAANNEKPATDKLRGFLKNSLPDYMVPSIFVFLEELPLTPNGKLDRKALPMPGISRIESPTKFKPPQNEIERNIATVWQKVLHINKISVEDNFFDLGGHSLLLVQVQNKLCNLFQREVSIIELFQYPTVKSLGNYFNQEAGADKDQNYIQHIAEKRKQAIEKQHRMLRDVTN